MLCPGKNGWGLNNNKQYLLSAMTRASLNINLYIVGYHKTINDWIDILDDNNDNETNAIAKPNINANIINTTSIDD